MKPRRNSLLATLLKSLVIPVAVAVFVGGLLIYNLATEEYDEQLDASLTSRAHLLLKIVQVSAAATGQHNALDKAGLFAFENETHDLDERSIFWFLDARGTILAHSPLAQTIAVPRHDQTGLHTINGYRVAVLHSKPDGKFTAIVAEPMTERNEAVFEILLGVTVSFLLLGVVLYGVTFWTVRRSFAIIADLSQNIAEKDEHNLSPISRHNSFAEIDPAIDTLDTLMSRLDKALTAERGFATNAAHELRTPVSICLAHVQRLKATLTDPNTSDSLVEIELGLKRLVRVIERLLEMSRAQSGLGRGAAETNIDQVISLLLNELHDRETSDQRLIVKHENNRFMSQVDPDALGIILNNLFDNALKHSPKDSLILVDASQPGRVVISNDCDPLKPDELAEIKNRFFRKTPMADGYGIGLSIVQALCDQSGCKLEILSPTPGKQRGLTVVLTIPPHQIN